MRLGVFGGTFDPPHFGHLILAMECRWQLNLDRVLWVLTPAPPHKQGQKITPTRARLEMVQACIDSDPFFDISTVDIDRAPPLYAVDTVKIIKQQYPAAQVGYLIGGDSLFDLPDWHTPQAFVAVCDFIGVMLRPHEQAGDPSPRALRELEQRITGLADKIHFVQAPLLEISSTAIRERVARRQPYRYYLPDSVYQIIEEQRLYTAQQSGVNQSSSGF